MSRNIFADDRDDGRDGELAGALGDALPKPPVDDVDWTALHARITASATPLLRQPQLRPTSWWQPLAQWSSRGIPLAAAAAATLMLGAVWLSTAAQPAAGGAFLMVEEALVDGVAYEAQPLLAGVEPADVLEAALFQAGEEW